MPFEATWMDLEILILSEVSHKEKKKTYDITYLWNLKYETQMILAKNNKQKTETEHGPEEQTQGSLGLGGRGGKLLYL